eukprot:746369-Hanusia_phi.AAC.2
MSVGTMRVWKDSDEGEQEKGRAETLDADVREVFSAAEQGDMIFLRRYVEEGGDVDACNELSDRLLHVTVRGGHEPATRLLLENKADMTIRNAILDTPLQIAMKRNQKDLVFMLMKFQKKFCKSGSKPSHARPLSDITNQTSRNNVAGQAGGGENLRPDQATCRWGSLLLAICPFPSPSLPLVPFPSFFSPPPSSSSSLPVHPQTIPFYPSSIPTTHPCSSFLLPHAADSISASAASSSSRPTCSCTSCGAAGCFSAALNATRPSLSLTRRSISTSVTGGSLRRHRRGTLRGSRP